jgi:hypothetical protein
MKNRNAVIFDVTFDDRKPVLGDSMDRVWMSETLKYFLSYVQLLWHN